MKTWDLNILYSDIDAPELLEDVEKLKAAIDEKIELAGKASELDGAALAEKYILSAEKIEELASKLFIYANLRYSADTRDTKAASLMGRLMGMISAVSAPDAKLCRAIAETEGLEKIIDGSEFLSEYKYFLTKIKQQNEHLLGDGEENVFAKMSISGASAWSDLQSALTSGMKAKYRGDEITLSSVRNLAYSPDVSVRRDAYEAEIAAYEQSKEAVAFALNSIKLQVLTECELRRYESPLAKALSDSRMTKETLDALLGAMDEYLPKFRKYLRAKAHALGHEGALPWYDLLAPLGNSDKVYTTDEAKDYLLGIFKGFDSELHDMVKTAFEENWIDFYPREGKVGGAFDCGVPSAKQSRVLTNFDGSFSDIVTLAHELGHSFHDRQVFAHSVLNQGYSMPVAETASTFNEVLVMETAINNAESNDEKLMLIESQLSDACQIICDILSRFLFEKSVFDNRSTEFMNADRLCELMTEAQKKSYGDGLDESCMHKYMWLCKGHYYSGGLSFYNFPYAFGGLFARGLYAKYKSEGESFVAKYKKLLYTTSISDVEDTAKIADIDLTCKDFWREGLESIAKRIDEFCELVGYNG